MDIARLGFTASTGDLDKAKSKLEALVPSAGKAETATSKFNAAAAGIARSTSGAATGILGFNSAVARAASGANAASTGFPKLDAALAGIAAGAPRAASGILAAGTAMGTIQQAAMGASMGLSSLGSTMTGLKMDFQQADAHMLAYRNHLATLPAAAGSAQSALNRLGSAANDNINRLQSTPGNIAAQFQDIGVTAAGGMQPYLIALQQGTQLSAAMQGGLGNLLAGFAQMLSPISLLTIAMVGLLATWIQSVDWYKAAAGALNMAADAMEAAAPYAAALGATLLLAFAPQIISWIAATTLAIGKGLVSALVSATTAMIAFAVANPWSAFVIGVGLAMAAIYALSEVFGGTFTTIIDIAKQSVNIIIGGFVGAFNAIRKTWTKLPAVIGDIVITMTNRVMDGVANLVNGAVERINGMIAQLPSWLGGNSGGISYRAPGGTLKNQFAGAASAAGDVASEAMKAAQGVDYIGKGLKFAKDMAGKAASALRGFAAGIGPEVKPEKTKKAAAGKKTEAEKQAEAFEKMRIASEGYVRSKMAEIAAIGLGERQAAMLKHTTDLTNQAIQQGIPLTDERTAAIKRWAAAMADADVQLLNAQGWQKLKETMEATNRDFQQQRDQLGMTADQTARYKWEVIWLNDAIRGLVNASPAQIQALRNFAKGAADNEVALGRMRDQIDENKHAMDFLRDGVKGFVSDLRSGLEQGKNAFSVFGNAVLNVLDKVIDKLIDVALNAAMGGGGSGVGGFLGGIAKSLGIGGSSGGIVLGGAAKSMPGVTANALGGVYGPSGRIDAYAKGGVVSGATMFRHAGGMGVMGEAGDEAIMPLKRGSDGSLGVAVNGRRGSNDNPAPNINVSNYYTISGSSTADMQATVRQSAEQTKDQLRREIPQVLAEYQRNGTGPV